jgi:hypothetical protein
MSVITGDSPANQARVLAFVVSSLASIMDRYSSKPSAYLPARMRLMHNWLLAVCHNDLRSHPKICKNTKLSRKNIFGCDKRRTTVNSSYIVWIGNFAKKNASLYSGSKSFSSFVVRLAVQGNDSQLDLQICLNCQLQGFKLDTVKYLYQVPTQGIG